MTVKTRLCPPLVAAEAAALYRCFLLDKIAAVRALVGAQPVVAYTPDEAAPSSPRSRRTSPSSPQHGPDLGARLHATLAGLLAAGHPAPSRWTATRRPCPASSCSRRWTAWLDPDRTSCSGRRRTAATTSSACVPRIACCSMPCPGAPPPCSRSPCASRRGRLAGGLPAGVVRRRHARDLQRLQTVLDAGVAPG